MARQKTKRTKTHLKFRTKRTKTLLKSTINSLPPALLIQVLAHVASSSITDLANAKLSCKDFNGASKDGHVLEHASMDKFPLVPWSLSDEKSTFLRLCKESGNAEALYRQGMIEFFSRVDFNSGNSGIENLRRAAMKGHVEACYVYGIVLLCRGGQDKVRGMELVRSMRNCRPRGFTTFRQCRKKVKMFVGRLWIVDRVIQSLASHISSENKTCCLDCHKFLARKHGWPMDGEDEDEDFMCSCRWDWEVKMFCNILMGRF